MLRIKLACIAALACVACSSCNDDEPKPHALLPGQSNQITPLARSTGPVTPVTSAISPAITPIAQVTPSAPPIGPQGFSDKFDRKELGPDWLNTGAPYRIENGKLVYSMAHNHPLWLNRALPKQVRIDFDCTGFSPNGDIKVELFGDGRTFENDEDVRKDIQYTATGYIFIFGGWKNQLSTIVKQQEHAWQYDKGVPRRGDVPVVPGQSYHFTIIRHDQAGIAHLEWLLDNKKFLSANDPNPLDGPGHDRFAFEGWETQVACSNLKIAPLQ